MFWSNKCWTWIPKIQIGCRWVSWTQIERFNKCVILGSQLVSLGNCWVSWANRRIGQFNKCVLLFGSQRVSRATGQTAWFKQIYRSEIDSWTISYANRKIVTCTIQDLQKKLKSEGRNVSAGKIQPLKTKEN